jgi:hypothetical protein
MKIWGKGIQENGLLSREPISPSLSLYYSIPCPYACDPPQWLRTACPWAFMTWHAPIGEKKSPPSRDMLA